MISVKEKHLNQSNTEVSNSKDQEGKNVTEAKVRNGETHPKRTLPSISKYNSSPYILPYNKSAHTNGTFKETSSVVKQKVYSATNLRMKHLENQLAENQVFMNELLNENKLLRRLQKRQDKALSRYEGSNAELPKLLNSHSEEIRILKEKLKQLRQNYTECERKLKIKDNELSKLKEKHMHLLQLVKDNGLDEREKLQKDVEELRFTVTDQNRKLQDLNRKIMLEEKNQKYYRLQETKKNRILLNELEDSKKQIKRLEDAVAKKNRKLFEPQSLKDQDIFSLSSKPAITFSKKSKFALGNSFEPRDKDYASNLQKLLNQISLSDNTNKNNDKAKAYSQYKPQPQEDDILYDQTMSDITDNIDQELIFTNSEDDEDEKITGPLPIFSNDHAEMSNPNNENNTPDPSESGKCRTVILSGKSSITPPLRIDKVKLIESLQKKNISCSFDYFHHRLNNTNDEGNLSPIHNGDNHMLTTPDTFEQDQDQDAISDNNDNNSGFRLEKEDSVEMSDPENIASQEYFDKEKLLETLCEIDNENKSSTLMKSSKYSKLLKNATPFRNGHSDTQESAKNTDSFQTNESKLIEKILPKNNLSNSDKNFLESL